jgi:hypothetical protein
MRATLRLLPLEDEPYEFALEVESRSEVESELDGDTGEGSGGRLLDGVPEEQLVLSALEAGSFECDARSTGRLKSLKSAPTLTKLRSVSVKPLVQRFDENLTHIINQMFDKAEGLKADANFRGWGTPGDISPQCSKAVESRERQQILSVDRLMVS